MMHKHVMKIVVVCAVAAAAVVVFVSRSGKASARIVKETVEVQTGDIRETVSTTGTVNPQNRLQIRPPIGGRIDQMLVTEGQRVAEGQVLALMSSTERATLLDAARLRGETELDYWQSVYKATPLLAPIDGTVIVRSVEPGQTVTASDTVVVLSDRLIVEADVDETDIGAVAVGQRAEVTLDAYPQISVPAVVDHISYESELVNNVTIYKVDILPESLPEVFRSGMSANVDIVVSEKQGAVLLPLDAVSSDNGRETVLLKTPGRKDPERVAVLTGIRDSEHVEILSGVESGDQVVVVRQNQRSLFKAAGTGKNPFMPSRTRGMSR